MLMFIFDRQAGNNTDHPSNSQGLAVPSELVLFAFFYLVSHFVPLYSSPTSWHNFIQRCVMPRRRLRLRRRLRRPHPYQRCASTSQKSPISLGPGYVPAIWLWNRNPRRSIVLKSKRSPRVACWSIASASVVFFSDFQWKAKRTAAKRRKTRKKTKQKVAKQIFSSIFWIVFNASQTVRDPLFLLPLPLPFSFHGSRFLSQNMQEILFTFYDWDVSWEFELGKTSYKHYI